MSRMLKTPFKQTESEVLCSAAATLCLTRLSEAGVAPRQICDIAERPQYGYTAAADAVQTATRFLRITDIRGGLVDWSSVPFCECPNPRPYLLRSGDLLVARSGSVGKSFLVQNAPEPTVFASYMIRIRAKPTLLPEFMFWCFQSQQFWKQILSQRRGSAMANINGTMLSGLEFPIPDIPKQAAIAHFLTLFQERLKGRIVDLGSLPPPLARVPEVVERIDQLAGSIQEAQSLRQQAIGESEALFLSSLTGTFESSRWSLKSLPEVADIARGKFAHRPRNEPRFYGGNIPFIQIGDISKANRYIRSYSQTLNEEGLAISRMFPTGTVAIAITGATIGVTGILGFDSCFPDSIVGIQAKPGLAIPEFIYLTVETAKKSALAEATQTTQPNINLENIRRLKVRVPALSEQRRVVAEFEALQADVDTLKHLQTETAAELNALLPAILDRAFKGELV